MQTGLMLREQARSHRTGVSQRSTRTRSSAATAATRAATLIVTATASMPTAVASTARPPERPAAGHG